MAVGVEVKVGVGVAVGMRVAVGAGVGVGVGAQPTTRTMDTSQRYTSARVKRVLRIRSSPKVFATIMTAAMM